MAKQSLKVGQKVTVLPVHAEAVLLRVMELRETIFELGDGELITLIDLLVLRAAAVSCTSHRSIAGLNVRQIAA